MPMRESLSAHQIPPYMDSPMIYIYIYLLDGIAISVVLACVERSSMALQFRVSPTVDGSWYMDVGRTPSIEFA